MSDQKSGLDFYTARGTRRYRHHLIVIRDKSHFRDLVIIDPSQTFRDLTHTDSTGSRVCDSGRGTPSRDAKWNSDAQSKRAMGNSNAAGREISNHKPSYVSTDPPIHHPIKKVESISLWAVDWWIGGFLNREEMVCRAEA